MELVKRKRPKVLESVTERVKTGCGHLYVTVGYDVDGNPLEIFAALGKAGGCSNCQNEALTRVVSLGLKYGIPVDEYVRELRGHQCPNTNMFPENERVLSCPDGIARVLENYKKVDNGSNKV